MIRIVIIGCAETVCFLSHMYGPMRMWDLVMHTQCDGWHMDLPYHWKCIITDWCLLRSSGVSGFSNITHPCSADPARVTSSLSLSNNGSWIMPPDPKLYEGSLCSRFPFPSDIKKSVNLTQWVAGEAFTCHFSLSFGTDETTPGTWTFANLPLSYGPSTELSAW